LRAWLQEAYIEKEPIYYFETGTLIDRSGLFGGHYYSFSISYLPKVISQHFGLISPFWLGF